MNPGFSSIGKNSKDLPISWLMEKALENPSIVSLAAGFTDNETLPVDLTRAAILDIFNDAEEAKRSLQYGTTRGSSKLRSLICKDLKSHDDHLPSIDPDCVVISHGSQEFLYQFCELFLDPGDIVIVEDPTYFVVLGLFHSLGVEVIGVPLNSDGVDVDKLAQILQNLSEQKKIQRLKFFYGVTYFQNPTGLSSDSANKLQVLELLKEYESSAEHQLYYLEDAAYFHLSFHEDIEKTALTFSEHRDRVVFTSTFSKPYSTGVRVGYGILPKQLVNPFLFIKTNHDFGTANFLQSIMAEVIDSGKLTSHLAILRKRYFEKCELLNNSLISHFPEWANWLKPKGGLYIWVTLPESCDTSLESPFFKSALKNEVLYVPGALCFAQSSLKGENGRRYKSTMRLTFGGASEQAITEGAERLGSSLKSISI